MLAGGVGAYFDLSPIPIEFGVPTPASLPLFASGLALMGWLAWRKKSALL
jgi:hypothetical protein